MSFVDLSSDSDWGSDAGCCSDDNSEIGTLSTSLRILPSWADTHGSPSNSKEYDDSQNISSKRRLVVYERPAILVRRPENSHPQIRPPIIDSIHSDSFKDPNHQFTMGNDSSRFRITGEIGEASDFVDLENNDEAHKKLNISGNNLGNASSQHAPKRILPTSFNSSIQCSKSKGLVENLGNSQNHIYLGKFSNPAGTNLAKNRSFRKDNFNRGSDCEIIENDNSGSRMLPPSLLHEKPAIQRSKSKGLVENLGNSQNHFYLGKFSNPAGTSLAKNRSFQNDNFNRGSDCGIIENDNSGSRMLPQSLLHGKPASHSQFIGHSDHVIHSRRSEERVAEHDESLVLQAALQGLNQPLHEATLPDGLLSVSLFRHQKIALHWMLQKENRSAQCRGGILADDQGLGKTVSMISLILMQRALQSKFKEEDKGSRKTEALNLDDDGDNGVSGLDTSNHNVASDDIKVMPEVGSSLLSFRRQRPAAGTLVVCPATVLRQWFRELNEKVEGAELSVLIYHGSNRIKDPVELTSYDVVLTTYSIVTKEVPKQPLGDGDDIDHRDGEDYGLAPNFHGNKKQNKKSTGFKTEKNGKKKIDASSLDSDSGTLAKVIWFRVILDEAQTIKNYRTLIARACWGLRAKKRWCLSGTPIQNSVDDLYSYFRFLRMDPYCVYKKFCNAIKYPISRNANHGYMKLNSILDLIMLRRTKDTKIHGAPIVNLPQKIIELAKIDFSTEERKFYSELEAESKKQFKAYAAAGTVKQNYANILLLLLRLRQACDHPLLVKGFNSGPDRNASSNMAKSLPKDFLRNLLSHLENNLAICCVCNDPPEDSVVTFCCHVFCYECISEHLTGEGKTCPVYKCTEQLGPDLVFSKSTLKSCIYGDISSSNSLESLNMDNKYVSSKIRAALEIVQSHCRAGKAIIFSQWTTMLNLLEYSMKRAGIPYRRLDGTMSLVSRDQAVKEFNTNPKVLVMLMSLKAGNLGLNMVAASLVVLVDLWWNPTTEDQAIDRAHRIGQTHSVTVSRLTINNSVEDRILSLQDQKRKIVAQAFGEDQCGGSKMRLTIEDLHTLFMG